MKLYEFDRSPETTDPSDYEIHNYPKLDKILVRLCGMVIAGMKDTREDHYGMVAACVLDTDNRMVAGLNTIDDDTDTRRHAERVAIEKYQARYGDIPEGSIIITTLSPCSESMAERYGDSCTELINAVGVKKIYCGYTDPTQEEQDRGFNIMETENGGIRQLCKDFADTFLDDHLVDEAFDRPYKTKTEKSESGSYDMLARLPDGTNLSIMFNNEGNDEWQVEFYRNNSQEVTGEGDAQRIFATVLNAILKFVKKHNPLQITFSASKEIDMDADHAGKFNPESRAKLYNRLVDRYAAALGYDARTIEHTNAVSYELTRYLDQSPFEENFAKPGVTEGNHWYAAGVADAQRDIKRNPNRKVKTLNPRTQLKTMQDKQARHPEEVEQYLLGYRSINPEQNVWENFADGKNPGRKGLSKRMGVNTKASVSSLRKTAKHSTGEKARMAHWLANMKAGRAKANKK